MVCLSGSTIIFFFFKARNKFPFQGMSATKKAPPFPLFTNRCLNVAALKEAPCNL